jgi:LDH2 family malate/lactate/ureidoglycolate dehydrogenase
MITLPPEVLRDFAYRLLLAAQVPRGNADLTARMLLAANLRGIDSHGVHLLSYYLKQIAAGQVDPVAEGRVVNESGACLVYDGQNGLGQAAAKNCCAHALRLARTHGLSMVTARETNHFGGCFWWARELAREGFLGIVFCNASSLVAPWQGKEKRFGTNPICMAVPPSGDDGQEPWLLDMATTTVAANKIFKAWINKQPDIPAGWAMDAEGVPTTNTEAAYSGLVMPLGGYKGYGLAMMVEILTAVLGGGAMSTELGGIRFTDRPVRVSHAYLAIDIRRFLPLEEFNTRIAKLVGMMKSSAPATGYDEILVAGEPEKRIEQERLATGIPILEGNWRDLLEAAERLGVSAPDSTL